MTNLSQLDNTSPFDSIRRLDQQGNEYWFATELLSLLGYKSWHRTKDTVKRAIASCQNSGQVVSTHFTDVAKKTMDWRLSGFQRSTG